MLPSVLLVDGYKVGHPFQYPSDTLEVYSNLTPRSGKRRAFAGDRIVWFGLQYFVQAYLQRHFQDNFFDVPKDAVIKAYKRRMDGYLGPDAITTSHIAALHELAYLPLRIKALPEGTLVPYNVPPLTITNTVDEFFWVTNMLETLMSCELWQMSTSATTAFQFRQTFEAVARLTGASRDFIPFQGHDFSFRGMESVEAAMKSGAAHLLSFAGTDTVPAIDWLEEYYGADSDKEMVGVSVPATEHSVMCMGLQDGERATFEHLLFDVYPTGILSVVSDSWDLWKVLTDYLPSMRDRIMARDGKLVIRPDSGDPVKIVCGDMDAPAGSPARKGAIQLLWDTFGGTVNEQGFKTLDPHVGLIYGDSITLERQRGILGGLMANGFASDNVVLGIGSYTYQGVTRDTDGWAMKATWGRTASRGPVNIFKDPVTDDGTKRSARGLLSVQENDDGLYLVQECTVEQEQQGLLENVFVNGALLRFETFSQIRERVLSQL